MKGFNQQIEAAVKTIRTAQLDASHGMPQEMFWMISALIPIINVDLLIMNEKGQILLTWRDDEFYRNCWHLPGGCIRYGETMIQRVHKTALDELGFDVEVDEKPVAIKDALERPRLDRDYPKERGHNVSVLFQCYTPDGYIIDNGQLKEKEPGYKKWFDKVPSDLVAIHHIYDDILQRWMK